MVDEFIRIDICSICQSGITDSYIDGLRKELEEKYPLEERKKFGSNAYKEWRKGSAEIWEIRRKRLGKPCQFLGPEEFYSSPYCANCLRKLAKELDNW